MSNVGDSWRLSMVTPAAAWMWGGVDALLAIGVVCLLDNRGLNHLNGVQGIPLNRVFPVIGSVARLVAADNKLSTGLEK